MGSTGSRPRLSKVAPCHRQREEGEEQHSQPKLQWTLPALPITVEQQSGALGQRKTTLPPLKQETTLSTLSEPFFVGSLPPTQSNNRSIIRSHPPRRPQALQPLALQIGHTTTANQIAMGKDCRDGGVHQFSTVSQTKHSGSNRLMQGGFLEAQTALSQQAHRHRRAHLRQAREQRRHKVVCTVNAGGPNMEGNQRFRVVKRPTERDIFWDETRGESLDPRCLLQPSPLPPLWQERRHNRSNSQLLCKAQDLTQRDLAHGCPQNKEEKNLPSTEDRLWTKPYLGGLTGREREQRMRVKHRGIAGCDLSLSEAGRE